MANNFNVPFESAPATPQNQSFGQVAWNLTGGQMAKNLKEGYFNYQTITTINGVPYAPDNIMPSNWYEGVSPFMRSLGWEEKLYGDKIESQFRNRSRLINNNSGSYLGGMATDYLAPTADWFAGWGAFAVGYSAGSAIGGAIGSAFAPGVGTVAGTVLGMGAGLAADYAWTNLKPIQSGADYLFSGMDWYSNYKASKIGRNFILACKAVLGTSDDRLAAKRSVDIGKALSPIMFGDVDKDFQKSLMTLMVRSGSLSMTGGKELDSKEWGDLYDTLTKDVKGLAGAFKEVYKSMHMSSTKAAEFLAQSVDPFVPGTADKQRIYSQISTLNTLSVSLGTNFAAQIPSVASMGTSAGMYSSQTVGFYMGYASARTMSPTLSKQMTAGALGLYQNQYSRLMLYGAGGELNPQEAALAGMNRMLAPGGIIRVAVDQDMTGQVSSAIDMFSASAEEAGILRPGENASEDDIERYYEEKLQYVLMKAGINGRQIMAMNPKMVRNFMSLIKNKDPILNFKSKLTAGAFSKFKGNSRSVLGIPFLLSGGEYMESISRSAYDIASGKITSEDLMNKLRTRALAGDAGARRTLMAQKDDSYYSTFEDGEQQMYSAEEYFQRLSDEYEETDLPLIELMSKTLQEGGSTALSAITSWELDVTEEGGRAELKKRLLNIDQYIGKEKGEKSFYERAGTYLLESGKTLERAAKKIMEIEV